MVYKLFNVLNELLNNWDYELYYHKDFLYSDNINPNKNTKKILEFYEYFSYIKKDINKYKNSFYNINIENNNIDNIINGLNKLITDNDIKIMITILQKMIKLKNYIEVEDNINELDICQMKI